MSAQEIIIELPESGKKIDPRTLDGELLVAMRVRGDVKINNKVKKTLSLLRLHKNNHAVLVRASKPVNGMLFKVKDFIAYGIIDKDTLISLIEKKGRLQGRKPITPKDIKNLTGKASVEELADALIAGEMEYKDIKKIVPVFRLHPPKGGFPKGVKKQVGEGGPLGFHGEQIGKLISKMI